MARVFIDGQAGTTGLEISQRLRARDDIELLEIAVDARKEPSARVALMHEADVTILCLPDDAAREAVALGGSQTRFLDASTAHRCASDWVYGCPELCPDQRSAIAEAQRVSNPGCYPQGFLLLIRPLIESGIVDPDLPLSVFGLSGYSGGGRSLIEKHQAFTPEQVEAQNTQPYALSLAHKHVPEMQHYSGCNHAPLFAPWVAHYYRGMLVQVPLFTRQFQQQADADAIRQLLVRRYADERFINVLEVDCAVEAGFLNACACNGSNDMQLFVTGNDEQILLIARYDNLGKGASGAAVQNLNLMLGEEESLGLSG